MTPDAVPLEPMMLLPDGRQLRNLQAWLHLETLAPFAVAGSKLQK